MRPYPQRNSSVRNCLKPSGTFKESNRRGPQKLKLKRGSREKCCQTLEESCCQRLFKRDKRRRPRLVHLAATRFHVMSQLKDSIDFLLSINFPLSTKDLLARLPRTCPVVVPLDPYHLPGTICYLVSDKDFEVLFYHH